MKKLPIITAAMVLTMAAGAGCTEDSPKTNPPKQPAEPITIERGTFAKGADVSWVTEFESQGVKFKNAAGSETELMKLLRDDCGVNSIRLRVWVNPTEGWCNAEDVLIKARRANKLGMRVMIDFHFSDWWADPAQQNIPAAWADMTLDEVKGAMTEHVNSVLTLLKKNGIEPEWVQIGNETRTGMMWPLGSLDNGDNFAQMISTGYDAVKAVFPEALVIVHCDRGDNQWYYDNLFGKLQQQGAKYDMIGMSLYPHYVDDGKADWKTVVANCMANITYVQQKYGKPVMIVEIGHPADKAEEAAELLQTVVDGCRERDVKGVFWWEPEAYTNGYGLGCFDTNGTPTVALNAFID